jgi:hypothetical protein
MKTRYRLTCRGIRGGKYYCVDTQTGKRTSLRTSNADEARQIVEAKNQSERQPVLNLHIAKAYLAGTDNGITTRTWRHAIESLINSKQGANQERWRTAAKDKALAPLLLHVIIETQGELLLKVLQMGTVPYRPRLVKRWWDSAVFEKHKDFIKQRSPPAVYGTARVSGMIITPIQVTVKSGSE